MSVYLSNLRYDSGNILHTLQVCLTSSALMFLPFGILTSRSVTENRSKEECCRCFVFGCYHFVRSHQQQSGRSIELSAGLGSCCFSARLCVLKQDLSFGRKLNSLTNSLATATIVTYLVLSIYIRWIWYSCTSRTKK